jgi:hypothetical protein
MKPNKLKNPFYLRIICAPSADNSKLMPAVA